ncbi:MAG: Asp-tRNA(Asn)/Glu-tRNA(Gln) amidotransferase subunit GatA [Candidatus Aenigmarchaeota archaeon]|nr:Asp-tRNA(Asn)/Glu-tRNA(Gln) amidotransferase subunit GatA [Candidatus Aenigmarchaeota archaeon]
MNHNISVQEFLKTDLNIEEFYSKLHSELETLQKKYNYFVTLNKEIPKKREGKLKGLPVSFKDCICTKGIQSTAGSKILEGYISPFDATVSERIKTSGGITIGKTVQDEFGFGTFSVNSGFGVPKNPIDPTRSCGGSSGGAAGLTKALNFPHIAISESTGGSISCPASFCGVVGLTPTYGLVSRYGLIDYANSLDKIGLMGKTVSDVALGLSVISGHDPKDSTSINKKPEEYKLNGNLKGLKIGIPKEYFQNLDKDVEKTVWNAIKKMESLGATYSEIELKMTEHALAAYYIIATSEASTNLAKFSGLRYGAEENIEGNFNEYFSKIRSKYFGEEAKRRILLGTFARMAGYRDQYYLKAQKVRTMIINEFKNAFKKHAVLLAPTMPVIAPKLSDIAKMSPLEQYMMDILNSAPNLAGIPHVNLPCGEKNNLPIGLHIMGDHLQEDKILSIGAAFEDL